jgi:DNA-binding transcriptional MocR family regulator
MTNIEKMEYLYQQIAKNIELKINSDVLRIGDKLPSVREICREQGVSMSTALEAYYFLEGRGLIESRPKSGYYVCTLPSRKIAVPEISKPGSYSDYDQTETLIDKVFPGFHSQEFILFSVGVPALELLPVARLNKALTKAMRELPGSGVQYEQVQGNESLRRQIARTSINWGGHLEADDLLVTSGCMDALCLSLMATTKTGDTIAVESPVYFGILQLAQSLGRKIIELPTDPVIGIDLDTLKKLVLLNSIDAVFLISNFNNPLGSCMPDENKREIVEFLADKQIPIIEDDIYADLYFGDHRPKSCKTFDKTGNVLWCGSISKTLAPGYRVGWVAPGRFKTKIIRQKLYTSISSVTITQQVIATFLESGRYENHLRRMRNTLHSNYLQMRRCISENFPETIKLSKPQGGFMLWVEFPEAYNTIVLLDELAKEKISIAPGRVFTLQDQYLNCMRLSYGLKWDEKVEKALVKIGEICGKIF